MAPLNAYNLLRLKKQNSIFVETGTHVGSSLNVALSVGYKKIYSVEFDEAYYNKAKQQFKNNSNVFLYYGDSATELGKMLLDISEPSTIFLDAHFCGIHSDTGLSDIWIPVTNELKAIKKYAQPDSVIIIDDLMAMDNTHFDMNTKKWAGAPGLEKLLEMIFDINPRFKVTQEEDRLICDLEDTRPVDMKIKEILYQLNDIRVRNKTSLITELISNIKSKGYPIINEFPYSNNVDVLEDRKLFLSKILSEL